MDEEIYADLMNMVRKIDIFVFYIDQIIEKIKNKINKNVS